MESQPTGSETLSAPAFEARTLYKAMPRISGALKAHKRSATAMASIFLVMLLAIAGTAAISGSRDSGLVADIKTFFESHSASAQGNADNTTHTISKPTAANSQQSAARPGACDGKTTTAASKPFSSCPSFSLNFAAMPNGSVDNRYFNVYTGKPEANDEAQYYTSNTKNVKISNGDLLVTALNDPQNGYKYSSARLDTKGKKDFLYGKIVIRATLPKSIGTWPAIWMLSTNEKYRSTNPANSPNHDLSDGEIDIAEAIGTEPNTVYGIAHSLAHPADGRPGYYGTTTIPGNDVTLHDYELDWTPAKLTFFTDGKPYFTMIKAAGADYRSWPYDQPYYLIINLALGGNWGGTDRASFPADGVDSNALPATMKIQSINYYPYVK